jgi:hypothetical protein
MMLPYHPYHAPVIPVPVSFGFQPPAPVFPPVMVGRPHSADCAAWNLRYIPGYRDFVF